MRFTSLTIALINILVSNLCAITLEEAIRSALKTHPEVEIARLNHDISGKEVQSARSNLYPHIELNAEYYPTKTFVMPSNGVFSTRHDDAVHADISATYTVYDFGRTQERLKASASASLGAKEQSRYHQEVVIEQVVQNYYTAAYLNRLTQTAEATSRYYEKLYQKALHMRQNGLKTQADESRFKASWLEAQDLLHSKRTEYRKSLYALEHLIGERVESIDGNELDRAVEEKRIPSIESMQQELPQKSPELKRLEAALAQARSNYNASKKQGYGTLSAVAGYGVDRSLSSYDSSYVGLKGNLPLFDGGYLDAQMQKSALSVQIAQQEYENTKKQLFEELFNAASDYEQAIQSIEAKEGLIDALEQTLHLMEGRYTQGLATYVDVLEAQNALDTAKNGLSGAKLTKIVRFARIERLLNKGCIDEICR